MGDRLPIDEVMDAIVEGVRTRRRVVVEAPPGAGKSTRVPPALLDSGWTDKQVVVLEPRRVAARAIASRIAAERGVDVGGEVGWQVRWDRRGGPATRLWVLTEGVLTRRILSDPFLEDVGILILDEFHERSVHTDLALGFAREISEVREDLAVVVMSATLDAGAVARFLECEAVRSDGRLHPTTTSWCKDEPADLPRAVRGALRELLDDPDDDGGDILVFLPGAREIDDCRAACADIAGLELHRLHGRLSDAEQDAALQRGRRRKAIFSTNIAETSLTIEGVTAVIDSGLARAPRADPNTGFDRVETVRTSRASIAQRAGRAGRLAPGRTVRLWTQASEFRLREHDEPELQRVDIASAVLDAMRWSGRPAEEFAWLEPPSAARLRGALAMLRALDAIEGDTVTEIGAALSEMPLHPRIGRFLLAANELGVGTLAADVAACLSESDWVTAVSRDAEPADADPTLRGEHLRDVAAGRVSGARAAGLSVDVDAARRTLRVARDLERLVEPGDGDPQRARRALVPAFADRVAFRASGRRYALSSGGSVVLGHESVVRDADVIVATTVFGTARVDGVSCGIVRQAAAIEESWLPAQRFRDELDVRFDRDLERLVARRVRRFDELVLGESTAPIGDSLEPAVAAAMAEAVAVDLGVAFGLAGDELHYLERIDFLREWMAELELPDPRAVDVLIRLVRGQRSFADLRKSSFRALYRRTLSGPQITAIDRCAPDRVALGARRFRVDYSDVEQPILAARIQDFFGVTRTPVIADGRVTLLLHLLAPNGRPAQVTGDLQSFWATTYAEVRKELRARYPKHRWPEDPNTGDE